MTSIHFSDLSCLLKGTHWWREGGDKIKLEPDIEKETEEFAEEATLEIRPPEILSVLLYNLLHNPPLEKEHSILTAILPYINLCL